jgi:hypothetical protein
VDTPVELQQIRDGLEDELRLLKRQYNEIASHLSQVRFSATRLLQWCFFDHIFNV